MRRPHQLQRFGVVAHAGVAAVLQEGPRYSRAISGGATSIISRFSSPNSMSIGKTACGPSCRARRSWRASLRCADPPSTSSRERRHRQQHVERPCLRRCLVFAEHRPGQCAEPGYRASPSIRDRPRSPAARSPLIAMIGAFERPERYAFHAHRLGQQPRRHAAGLRAGIETWRIIQDLPSDARDHTSGAGR